MHSTSAFAAAAAMASFALVSASPVEQSSNIPIPFPTGAEAVTAAPPVPTFGTVPAASPDIAEAALGNANVRNHCPYHVYLYVCDQHGCGAEVNVGPNTGTWSAPISSTQGDGVSIKIGTTPGEVQKAILQLEYTNKNGLIYFDASQVNGNPFGAKGYALTDSVGLDRYCAPPCTNCPFVFNTPTSGTVFNIPNTASIGLSLCASS